MKIRTTLAIVGMASTTWMIAINVVPARAQPNQADGWPTIDWPWPKLPDWQNYTALATGFDLKSCRRVVERGDGSSEGEAKSDASRRCRAGSREMHCHVLAVKDGCVAVAVSSRRCGPEDGLGSGYDKKRAENDAIYACEQSNDEQLNECRIVDRICLYSHPLRHR
jgi:hypothetical protein